MGTMSVSQAMAELGLSRNTIKRRIQAGMLVGWQDVDRGWWQVDAESVRAYRAARIRTPTGEPPTVHDHAA